MIDIVLMYNLLKAVPPHMTVITIGDVDQLPSIGAGNVLRDIIDNNVVPVINLKKIFRQAQGSTIILNAHKINKRKMPNLYNGNDSDFFFVEQRDNSLVPQIICELCSKRLPSRYNVNPIKDIQVLCPMQRGETGAINLNSLLQNVLNRTSISLKRGGIEYRINDKVMQIKNNYDKNIYNGDIGIISNVNLSNKTIIVIFDDKEIEYNIFEMDELALAYATTIHKAQGSEYKIVVMPILMSHHVMLQRNLIYTGITRAKELIFIVGSKEAIYESINNNNVAERNTDLKNRLIKII